MNFSELSVPSDESDEPKIIEYLQKRNILRNPCICRCKNVMKLTSRMNRGKRLFYLRCVKCHSPASVKTDSIFETYKLSVLIITRLIIHWVMQTSYVNMSKLFSITRQTCSEFCQRLRVISVVDYDRENVLLGGAGEIIEVYESLSDEVKHYKAKNMEKNEIWVFGMRERSSNKCYFEIVPDRELSTFLKIIFKHVRPHTVVFSENWNSYSDMARIDFQNETSDEPLHFVKPGTSFQTADIKGLWDECKRRFKTMNGCSRVLLQSYIDEFCWRNNLNQDNELIFDRLIEAIDRHFPLDGTRKIDWCDKYFTIDGDDDKYFHEVKKHEKIEVDENEEKIVDEKEQATKGKTRIQCDRCETKVADYRGFKNHYRFKHTAHKANIPSMEQCELIRDDELPVRYLLV